MMNSLEVSKNLFDEKISEIFTSIPEKIDDANTPPWASLIVSSMRGLCSELKNLNNNFSMRIDQLEIRNHVNEQKIKQLEDEKAALEVKLEQTAKELGQAIDDNSQYSRRNCLLLHGIEEDENEHLDAILTNTFNGKLGLQVSVENMVGRTHRIGKQTSGRITRNNKQKVRPIIVKFLSYRTRRAVFQNKKNLKGSGIVITESLTQKRYKLLLAAQEKLGFKSVWTTDGRIMANVNNRYFNINSYDDLT